MKEYIHEASWLLWLYYLACDCEENSPQYYYARNHPQIFEEVIGLHLRYKKLLVEHGLETGSTFYTAC